MIAAAHHMSVSSLHRLFGGGRSVQAEIRARRLERCRQDLIDPRWSRVTIAAVAARHGYLHQEVLSRHFRAAYGVTPRDMRKAAAEGAWASGPGGPAPQGPAR
jgi:AraC-like DNA-binding protein